MLRSGLQCKGTPQTHPPVSLAMPPRHTICLLPSSHTITMKRQWCQSHPPMSSLGSGSSWLCFTGPAICVFSRSSVLWSASHSSTQSLGLLSKGLLTITHLRTAAPAWVPHRSSHTAAWALMSETAEKRLVQCLDPKIICQQKGCICKSLLPGRGSPSQYALTAPVLCCSRFWRHMVDKPPTSQMNLLVQEGKEACL